MSYPIIDANTLLFFVRTLVRSGGPGSPSHYQEGVPDSVSLGNGWICRSGRGEAMAETFVIVEDHEDARAVYRFSIRAPIHGIGADFGTNRQDGEAQKVRHEVRKILARLNYRHVDHYSDAVRDQNRAYLDFLRSRPEHIGLRN